MVTGWFGLFRVLLCSLLRHSVYLQFTWGFQTIHFPLHFKMRHNPFICGIRQMRLVNWFVQVGGGGSLAYMKCSKISWAATPNATFASFWSSSKKSNTFWFAGLKTSRRNFCFALALDWGCTYFQGKTVRISLKISLFGLLMFLKVCSASLRMREWK